MKPYALSGGWARNLAISRGGSTAVTKERTMDMPTKNTGKRKKPKAGRILPKVGTPRIRTWRQVLDIVDTVLSRRDPNASHLWYVLTALRGPDNGSDYTS